MIKKIINTVLGIILLILPIIILPPGIFPDAYNIPKIILLYICGIILLICLIINHKKLKFDKTDKLLLYFVLLIGISTIFSVNIKKSLLGSSNRYEGFFTFICYFLIYYSTKYYFKFNSETFKNFLFIIFFTSFLAILQYYDVPIIYELFKSKHTGNSFASSTFGNRNFFASFASMCVPLTMCLYIFYRKKIYLLLSAIAFYALLASLTRSSWLAFGVISIIGIIYIIKNKNKTMFKRGLKLFLTFIFTFLVFYFSKTNLFIGRYETTVKDVESLTTKTHLANSLDLSTPYNPVKHSLGSGRAILWASAFKVIQSNPITGCGTDAFASEILKNHNNLLTTQLYPAFKGIPDKVHNEYLQLCATNGIPSIVIYISFLFLTLKNLLACDVMKNKRAFTLFLCIVSYLIQAFFNISTIGVAPIIYFLLGYSYQFKKQKLKN